MEECTFFWAVKTSWGINTDENKRPLNQEDNQAPQPTGLIYTSNIDMIWQEYIDSDWAGSVVDRKRTFECFFTLGSSMVS
jgi:hypothetical protein